MRVVMAPDSYGGSLTAAQAAAALARGWQSAAPGDQVVEVPLSDGGAGLVEVLAAALPDARRRAVRVQDPLGRPVGADFLLHGATAYVEAAAACGLHLLADDERDPRRTSSHGVGELLRAAVDAGATRVVVGLGGSGTNDGGAGALAALGAPVRGSDGRILPPGGAALRAAARIDGWPQLDGVELVVATDVDSPLLGLSGASATFGPQKGASREDVAVLDAALTRWAEVLEAQVGRPVRDVPGAGAAGGLGAALIAIGARREPGIALVQRLVGLPARVARAELVVTGEGTLDGSSLSGKVVSGVAALAAEHAVPCLVLAGAVRVGRREAAAAGIEATYSLVEAVGVRAALARPAQELSALAARVARQWSPGARVTMEGS